MMNKMRDKMMYLGILFIPIISYFVVATGKGYYPMPMGIKKLYYAWKIERSNSVSGPDNVIDKNFCFYQDGYFTNKEIKSSCSLPHILSLAWAEPNSPVPLDYTFQGKVCIEIYKEEKLLYSQTTSSTVNQYEYGVQGKPSRVYAIGKLKVSGIFSI